MIVNESAAEELAAHPPGTERCGGRKLKNLSPKAASVHHARLGSYECRGFDRRCPATDLREAQSNFIEAASSDP